jgi:hypothetical protein
MCDVDLSAFRLQMIYALTSVLADSTALVTSSAAVRRRTAVRQQLISVLAAIAGAMQLPTERDLAQVLMLIDAITAVPTESTPSMTKQVLGMVHQLTTVALTSGCGIPMDPELLQAALGVIGSAAAASVTGTDAPSVSSNASSAATARAIVDMAALTTQGAVLGLSNGDPPVVLRSDLMQLSVQRQSPQTLASGNASVGSIATTGSTFTVPTSFLRDVFPTGNLPASLDAAVVQYTSNMYAFADDAPNQDATALRPSAASALVSFTIYTASASGRLGAELSVVNLTQPVLITIAHAPMPAGEETTCRFWDAQADRWSSVGCRVFSREPNCTTCACTHLTVFNLARVRTPTSTAAPLPPDGCVALRVPFSCTASDSESTEWCDHRVRLSSSAVDNAQPTCVCVCVCVCVWVRAFMYVYACMYVCMYVCMRVCVAL